MGTCFDWEAIAGLRPSTYDSRRLRCYQTIESRRSAGRSWIAYLNNAFRHGRGEGQNVRGSYVDVLLRVEVSDAGPGFDPDSDKRTAERRLGLTGMRDRVASLGGALEIQSQPGRGTRLTARFKVSDDGTIQQVAGDR